ncbi:MAG: sulfurtransferase [Burkholderiales bacterium]|nr:sulfurtransferase [Burkholderiales bacterium]
MASHRLSSLTDQIAQADGLLAHPSANRLFIDVRLGEPAEELRSFRDAHIHGAVHAQIRDVFAGPAGPDTGTLPLPAPDMLRQQLIAWGVDGDTELIVYGPSVALAARAWWVLRWAGLRKVRVLDGGIKAWTALGGPLAQGDAPPRTPRSTAALVLQPGGMPEATVNDVEEMGPETLLLDARDESAFLAGAIPGAVNLPSSLQWTPGATLRTVEELSALYAQGGALQARDVVAYCGGGVLSALTVLTLSALGATPRLFVGSWSEWSRDPTRMARSATATQEAA